MDVAPESTQDKSCRLDLAEAIYLLAGQVRESRETAVAQFLWFQSHLTNTGEFSREQKKTFAELVARLEADLKRDKDEILAAIKPKVRIWSISFDQDEPMLKVEPKPT